MFVFNDNGAAARGLVKGYAGSASVCAVVGRTWRQWIQHDIVAWVEWVHTKSNPADALTRDGWKSAAAVMGVSLEEVAWRCHEQFQ